MAINSRYLRLIEFLSAAGTTCIRLEVFTQYCNQSMTPIVGIVISNCRRVFFMIRLNSSSSGSSKKILRNFLALFRRGFSIVHFCLSLRFDASDICFHTSGHAMSDLEVVCFLVTLSPDHVYASSGFSFNTMSLVKPLHASDNSLSPSTLQESSICFSSNTSNVVVVRPTTFTFSSGVGSHSSFGAQSLTLGST